MFVVVVIPPTGFPWVVGPFKTEDEALQYWSGIGPTPNTEYVCIVTAPDKAPGD